MDERPIHLALREMQSLAGNLRVWVGLTAVSLVLGLSGPYGTNDLMRFLPRLGYWTLMAVVTFATGSFLSSWAVEICRRRRTGPLAPIALAAVTTGLAVAAEVLAINWLALGTAPDNPTYVVEVGLNAMIIAIVVAAVLGWQSHASKGDISIDPPRLLNRLPFDKRGALVSLSVQDHYVQVTTTKGSETVLMRLSDAMAETGHVTGLQVHRSHWVALDQIARVRRQGNKATLTLIDQRQIPVSRTFLPALRQAGLLPGKGDNG